MQLKIKQFISAIYDRIFKVERNREIVVKVKLQPDGTWKRFKGAAGTITIPLPKRKKRLNDRNIKAIVKSMVGTVHIHRSRPVPVGFIFCFDKYTYFITIHPSGSVGYSEYLDDGVMYMDLINSNRLKRSKLVCVLDDLR